MSTKSEKSSKVPIRDGSNYTFWKARVQIDIKSKDERIWHMVVRGYTAPIITDTYVKTSQISEEVWNESDLNNSKCNNKGINAIQCNVNEE